MTTLGYGNLGGSSMYGDSMSGDSMYGDSMGMYGSSGYGSMGMGQGFDLYSVSATLGNSLQATESQMTQFMQQMNPNNMDDILQMQMYMIQWETVVQTESSVYKGIGDSLKSVANNVGS